MSLLGAASERRWGGGGLMLAALLVILLLVPLWKLRDHDHPLAGVETLDLCPLLPPPPASLGEPKAAPGSPSYCSYLDARGQLLLRVSLNSTRQMSRDGAVDSERLFENWMKEVRASYGNGGEVTGPWRHGGAWKQGAQQSLLFEDRGVMVLLESGALDASQLQRHAQAVQAALRRGK